MHFHCSYLYTYYKYSRTLCIKCWVSKFHTKDIITSWSLLGPRVEVGLTPNIMKGINIFTTNVIKDCPYNYGRIVFKCCEMKAARRKKSLFWRCLKWCHVAGSLKFQIAFWTLRPTSTNKFHYFIDLRYPWEISRRVQVGITLHPSGNCYRKRQQRIYLWRKVVCFVLFYFDLSQLRAIHAELWVSSESSLHEYGCLNLVWDCLELSCEKLFIVEPFSQWKLNNIKTESWFEIWGRSWCYWKALEKSNFNKFYFHNFLS
jgi:hypothetical protein